MPGGGGASGEVGFPTYMENIHKVYLYHEDDVSFASGEDKPTYSINHILNVLHGSGGNPYEGETAFNPNAALTINSSSPLGRIDSQYSATKTLLDALDAETDWQGYVDSAYDKTGKFTDIDFLNNLQSAITGLLNALEDVLDSSIISDMVDAFEANKKTRFKREVSQWSAAMADVGAVHTSSFIMGLSLWQKEFSDMVDSYEKELRSNIYRDIVVQSIGAHVKAQVLRVGSKDQMVLGGAELMARLNQMKVQMEADLTQVKAEIERITMISLKEQKDRDLDIDANEALWELETYMYAGNMLGSISGAAAGRKAPKISDAQSALSGAFAGASIMSVTKNPWLIAGGAAVGGLLGWALN